MMGKVNIHFNSIIHRLLCLYAFFIPFERILKILFDIDTILKPYRVFALLAVAFFAVKSFYRWHENRELKRDIFLYSIFGYGFIITIYRMITTNFSLPYMLSDNFQILIYLSVFVVIRHMNFSREQIYRLIRALFLGILANAFYAFYIFYIARIFFRSSGFMDNPNYLAFSLVMGVNYLIVFRENFKGVSNKILWWVILAVFGMVLISTGSRMGLAMLILSGMLSLYFSSVKDKIILVAAVLVLSIFIGYQTSTRLSSGAPLILLRRINKDSSKDPRIPAWEGTIRAAEKVHFLGLGVGQFKHRFVEFFKDENHPVIKKMVLRGYFLSPHSDYFALLAVYGIFGLLAYLIFLFLSMVNIINKVYTAGNKNDKIYYQFGCVAFLSLILFGITAENFNSALFWTFLTTSTMVTFE